MYKKFQDFNLKYKYWSFALVLLTSLWGFSKGKDLHINLSLSGLLPDHDESVVDMNKVSAEVGGVGHLMLLIGPTHHPEDHLQKLASELGRYPDIKYIFYEKEKYLLQDNLLYLMPPEDFQVLRKNVNILLRKGKESMLDMGLEDKESQELKLQEAKNYFQDLKKKEDVQRYYLSRDKHYALMMIKPTFESIDLKTCKKLNDFVRGTTQKVLGDRVSFQMLGRYVEKVEDTKQIERDIMRTGVISAIGLALVLIWGLGSFRAAFATLVGVFLALGQTTAAAYYLVGQINILTGFLLAILAGLGAEYGIHLIRRYYQEIELGKNHKTAFYLTYYNTGRALLSAALTTVAGFFSLYISDFRGFSELGIIAGFGCFSIYLVFNLCFPVLALMLKDNLRFAKSLQLFAYYPFKMRSITYFALAVPIVLWGLPHAEFEYDFNRMRDVSSKTREIKQLSESLYGRSTSPSALLAKDSSQAKEVEDWLRADKFKDVVEDAISLHRLVPEDMESRQQKIQKIKKIVDKSSDRELREKTGIDPKKIRKWLQAAPYTVADLPIQLKESFGKKGNVVLSYPEHEMNNGKDLKDYAEVLYRAKKQFPGLMVGSDTLMFDQILDHVFEDGKYVLLIFLAGTMLTFLLDFRDLRSALVLEFHLICGMIFLIGLMGAFGIRFTIMNVAMIPAVLATGIDMGVHIRHREKEGLRPLKSARVSAQPIHVSVATTIVGFGSLFFADAKMLKDIAWIAVLGQISMYLVCMYFTPVLKDYLKWTTVRKGREKQLQGD